MHGAILGWWEINLTGLEWGGEEVGRERVGRGEEVGEDRGEVEEAWRLSGRHGGEAGRGSECELAS